jgi:hypothetical protein
MDKTISKSRLWTGRIMSGLVILFLTFDGIVKLMNIQPVVDGMKQLGYPVDLAIPLGVVLLTSTILYVIPKTSFIGGILLTGYLGGAVATHVRVQDPLFTHTLFPVYFGILLWAGLYLRDRRLTFLTGATV